MLHMGIIERRKLSALGSSHQSSLEIKERTTHLWLETCVQRALHMPTKIGRYEVSASSYPS